MGPEVSLGVSVSLCEILYELCMSGSCEVVDTEVSLGVVGRVCDVPLCVLEGA